MWVLFRCVWVVYVAYCNSYCVMIILKEVNYDEEFYDLMEVIDGK